MTYHHYASLEELARRQQYQILATTNYQFLATCKISKEYCIVGFKHNVDFTVDTYMAPQYFQNQNDALANFIKHLQ